MFRTAVIAAAALAVIMSAGCAKKVSIEEGRAKIEELAGRGVPEREMSSLKMYLYEMETAKKVGNGGKFKTYQDSLTAALGSFEEKMNDILEKSGPFIDSLRKACDEKAAQLKGLHLEAAEKGKRPVDSLLGIESRKLYARSRLEAWSLNLDTLAIQQQLADSLRKHAVGIWVMEQASEDKRYPLVRRQEFHMKTDGSFFMMEGSKGKLDDHASEDWLFNTFGTWDMKGDTVFHKIAREKRVRQIFEGIDPQTGKKRKDAKPPYDSTVTGGKKDSYISWKDLNKDYKRFPIR